jgi:D-beta-D-heptose 7-phosphate kinase/D-beta-D-heptose 1-phosphate adenosyltransferase
MSAPHVVVIGDAVLDVDVTGDVDRVGPESCMVLEARDERRRPGAAALAASFASADGADVTLVTAIGRDEAGHFLRRRLGELGLQVVDAGLDRLTPQKWRLRTADGTLLRLDRDCADPGRVSVDGSAVAAVLDEADAVLVADYGRGVAQAVAAIVAGAAADRPVVWDPHRRGQRPPRRLDLLTPNEHEASTLQQQQQQHHQQRAGHGRVTPPADVASRLATSFQAAVAVTCGAGGAVLAEPGGARWDVPATAASGDTCGAGDRFAARVAVERARGTDRLGAVSAGVAAASRYVATGDVVATTDGDAFALAAQVRERGGRVIATGGCFDLLHAGHVQLLQSARAMGDLLVVCLNGDGSVRRLKGPGRPVVGVEDRRRVLEALGCVDAVAVFDEDTPIGVLERLRPHVFVKGGDYVGEALPERAVLERWGGRIAILPLSDGRSTTRLLQLARARAS